MPTQAFDTIDVLRLEVEDDPTGLVNLVQNPSGYLGGWGWITPVTGSTMRKFATTPNNYSLRYVAQSPSGPSYFYSEPMPIAAGQYAAAYYETPGGGTLHRVRLEWLKADGTSNGSTTQSGYVPTPVPGTQPISYSAQQAPAGAVAVRLRFDLYGNTSGGNPAAGAILGVNKVTVAVAATAGALSGLTYLDPVPFVNVLGPTSAIQIARNELEAGLLTATILDATLDPASATLVRPGKRCRVMALDPADGLWSPLLLAKIQNGKVTYDATRTDARRARIVLSAIDNVAVAASVPRSQGVATIAELPFVLEGAGIPWSVNGSGNQVPSATIVATNENASALDQVAVTRDSVHGYAWVDRYGVLQARDASQISTTVAATLDEDDYSALPLDFDTERCINTVTVKYLRPNLATGETVEVSYGPYVDQDSVDTWGPHPAEFTVQGIGEANVPAFGAAVLAANATPVLRVNSVTLPIATTADVAKALTDLYDLVTVTNTNAGLDQDLRVTGVTHTIAPDRWDVELEFAADGGVAPPVSTPSPVPAAGGGAVVAVTTASGVTSSASGVFKRGDVAIVQVNITTTAAIAAAGTLFTLPPGLRPNTGAFGIVVGDVVRTSDGASIRLHVLTTGEVQTQVALATGAVLRGQVVIPL